jgi:hypothetical protein
VVKPVKVIDFFYRVKARTGPSIRVRATYFDNRVVRIHIKYAYFKGGKSTVFVLPIKWGNQ